MEREKVLVGLDGKGELMLLKNKKTGEIIEVESLDVDSPTEGIVGIPSFDRKGSYNSLAELNAEWEDYEEPKEYWYIDPMVCGVYCTKIKKDEDLYDFNKQIGNYFLSREEAEKAVEKLKAWKRLKDKGFRFTGLNNESIGYEIKELSGDFALDLDLLFNGGENG